MLETEVWIVVAVAFSSVTQEKHIARAQIDKDGGPRLAAVLAQGGQAWAEFRPCVERA
jgi:hypothetical protein